MFYLHLNGAQAGPYSLEQLKDLWKEGNATADTLYWQEGMTDWKPLGPILNLAVESTASFIICGFWRRLGAYVIDTLILGALGLVLGLLLASVFMHMGVWALLIGLTISLLYFGLMNSSLGQGQTLGKRLLGLEVVDRGGHYLSPGRSILRYLVFAFPFYLNGFVQNSGMNVTSWPTLLLCVLIFVGGGAILYLFIFNRRTRQSLHDLAVGSYVVRSQPRGIVTAPPVWKVHFIVIGMFTFLIIGSCFVAKAMIHTPFFEKLIAIQEDINATGRMNVIGVTQGVNVSYMNGQSTTSKTLSVKVNLKERVPNSEPVANEIAAIVLKDDPDIAQDDALIISVSSGYNIGIYSSSATLSYSRSPDEWKSLVAPTN